jgi:hypothetical protein
VRKGHLKGCGSGVSCFCHFGAPGEKKRQQKLKHDVAKISADFEPVNAVQPLMYSGSMIQS